MVANRFSSVVVRWLLLCVYVSVGHVFGIHIDVLTKSGIG